MIKKVVMGALLLSAGSGVNATDISSATAVTLCICCCSKPAVRESAAQAFLCGVRSAALCAQALCKGCDACCMSFCECCIRAMGPGQHDSGSSLAGSHLSDEDVLAVDEDPCSFENMRKKLREEQAVKPIILDQRESGVEGLTMLCRVGRVDGRKVLAWRTAPLLKQQEKMA